MTTYGERLAAAEELLAVAIASLDECDQDDHDELAHLQIVVDYAHDAISAVSGDFDEVENDNKEVVVVTRHANLVDYLTEVGVIVEGEYTLIEHAAPDAIRGKHVVGILPHSLSVLCASFTEVPLHVPAEKRGTELSIEDLREYAQPAVTYVVTSK